jgi:hypothetical protein
MPSDALATLIAAALAAGKSPEEILNAMRSAARAKAIDDARAIPSPSLAPENFTALVTGVLNGRNAGDLQEAYRYLITVMRQGNQSEFWPALLVFLKAFRQEHSHWEHVSDAPAPVGS